MKLSKREIILLTMLLIIGLFFIEFRFIISPGLSRFMELTRKEESLVNEIDTINLNLTIAATMQKKRDENLQTIEKLSEPYIDGVNPDSLLVFTHGMMVKHGFIPSTYGLNPISLAQLVPQDAVINPITYRIKEIALEYQALNGKNTVPKSDTSGTTSSANPTTKAVSEVENYAVKVNATGTYSQVNALLDEFTGLNRMLIVSNLNLSSAQAATGTLNVSFEVKYFGIMKLKPTENDPLEQWTRPALPTSMADPFTNILPPVPTPTPTPTR